MKRKIFVFSITLAAVFLFGEYYINNNVLFADGKPDAKECPYLKGKAENSCPNLKEKSDDSYSSCPYLRNENKSKSDDTESGTNSCPYLKYYGKSNKTYQTIKNTSI